MSVDAILFDKDGTLFDFSSTWRGATERVISDLSGGNEHKARRLAEISGFEPETGRFLSDSILVARSNREIAEALAPELPDLTVLEIERAMIHGAAQADLAPAVPLPDFLDALLAQGLLLGVVTNDAEQSARNHLKNAGILEHFGFVAGFDSGHGAKPAPGPLFAFCQAVGVAPARTVMVGDSTHDLAAGRAAGMQTLGVLTGVAEADELRPLADAVLPDIGHIPAWLWG